MKQFYLLEKLRFFFLSAFAILSAVSLGNAQGTVTLNAGSSGTWVVPCGVTEITVQAWGGGGAGGAATSNNNGGGGGGSGGYVSSVLPVTEGQSFSFQVGTGGAPTGAVGNHGTTTLFGTMTAGRGFGGAANNGLGGNGGVALGGNQNNIPGQAGIAGSGTSSGKGGDSPLGGAGGAGIQNGNSDGNSGEVPGAGGGGGAKYAGTSFNAVGGAGAGGRIRIVWDAPFSAGTGQSLPECVATTQLNADPLPPGYSGAWSVLPVGPTFLPSNSDPNATVSNLALNQSYTFTWTVNSNPSGSCPTVTDDVIIATQSMPVNAGFDQNFCQVLFTLQGNDPFPFNGLWTQISGPAITITNPTSPNATVTGLAQGQCVTLRWTLTDPISGCVGFDDVIICRPAAGAACNDSPCSAESIPVSGCALSGTTFAGATATQNPGQPGCGGYTFYGGDKIDVWFTATTDANGNLNLNLSGNSYLNAAIYTGSCTNLTQFSCHGWNNTTGPLSIQETNLPPNTVVFIRVWKLTSPGGTFSICQVSSTNNSVIQPGATTVDCAISSSLFDSGGSTGNYGNNELTTWLLCPSVPGQFVSITFTSINIAAGDQLVITDGNDASDPFINVPNSSGSITYTSSHPSGCLMLSFRSNESTTAAGWVSSVSCSPTPPNNTSLYAACNEQNCLGGCMRVLCDNNTVGFQGNGFGTQELNFSNNGCMDSGERCTNWFYINPNSAGTLTMDMFVNNGQNQDFAVWEGYPPSLDCPSITGQQPILCNIGPSTNIGTGFNSNYSSFNSSYEDDLVITPQQIADGMYLILMVQTFSNGNSCPQPNVQITFGGDVGLDCTDPVNPPSNLPISLLNFNAVNMGSPNHIFWNTASERDNDFFTIEHSMDGKAWEQIGTVKGAGTSVGQNAYHYNHYGYTNVINYYRLKQTDYDGTTETFHIVSVDNRSDRIIIRTVNMLGQHVNTNYKGIVIDQYSDGTSEKRYNH